jgi:hypothetical protein
MTWQTKFLRKFERVAIPNVTGYWVAFQCLAMFLIWTKPEFVAMLQLDTGKMLAGEWWRLLTFLFMPVSLNPVLALFVLYFYWMMGNALEANWGVARYNLFLLIGAALNVVAAFLPVLAGRPGSGSNFYLMESVFLGFAALYPDYVIYIFFIIPIRVKWLALVTWILLGVQLLFALGMRDFTDAAMIIASMGNFLIFFRREIVARIKSGHTQMRRQIKKVSAGPEPVADAMHRCTVCGATERSAPQLEFRYCASCGNKCYCLEHLRTHACMQQPAALK